MEIDQLSLKSLVTTKGDEILGTTGIEALGVDGKEGDAAGFLQQLLGEFEKLKGGPEGEVDVEEDADVAGQLADPIGKILPQKETNFRVDNEILENMVKGPLSEQDVDEIPLISNLSDTLPLEQITKIVRQLTDVSDGEGSAFVVPEIPVAAVGSKDSESRTKLKDPLAIEAELGGDADFSLIASLDVEVDNDGVSYALAPDVAVVQKTEEKVDGKKIATLDPKPIADRWLDSSGYKDSESEFTRDPEPRLVMGKGEDKGVDPETIPPSDREVSVTAKVATEVLAVAPGAVSTPANNLAVASNSIQPSVQSPLGQPGWDQEFAEQVVWMSRNSLHIAELRLNPRHLGPVEVKIKLHQDQAEIVFSSQHSVVREAIEAALPKLRDAFMAQQIDLGDVNVSQQTFSEQRESQQQKGEMPYDKMISEQDNASENERQEVTTIPSEMNTGLVSYYV